MPIALFAVNDVEHCLGLARAAGALSAPVNSATNVIAQEHAAAREMLVDLVIVRLKTACIPVKISGTAGRIRSHPRVPGADTDEIPAAGGYSPQEIAGLREQKVVA